MAVLDYWMKFLCGSCENVLVDVIPIDRDVIVAVRSGLFVKEAKSMHEFMLNDSLRHAADSKTSSQVDSLSASLLATNVGTAAFSIDDVDMISTSIPRHKFDALFRPNLDFLFKVSHRTEDLVFVEEEESVGDDVWNNSVFPNP